MNIDNIIPGVNSPYLERESQTLVEDVALGVVDQLDSNIKSSGKHSVFHTPLIIHEGAYMDCVCGVGVRTFRPWAVSNTFPIMPGIFFPLKTLAGS